MILRKFALTAVALVASVCAQAAEAASYGISWIGNSGYTLEGSFSFDDSLLGSGAIDESNLDSLSFSVLEFGVSKGTATLPFIGGGTLNFNFDTATELFAVGGNAGSSSGQAWNFRGNPVGFVSGAGQHVSEGSDAFGGISILDDVSLSTLTAYRIDVVPVPASLPLLAVGLAGLGFMARRKRKAA